MTLHFKTVTTVTVTDSAIFTLFTFPLSGLWRHHGQHRVTLDIICKFIVEKLC